MKLRPLSRLLKVLNSAACAFGVGVAAGNPGVKLLNAAGEAVAAEVTAAAAAADRGGAAVDVLDQWALSYARQTVGSSHHCKSTAPCRAAVDWLLALLERGPRDAAAAAAAEATRSRALPAQYEVDLAALLGDGAPRTHAPRAARVPR